MAVPRVTVIRLGVADDAARRVVAVSQSQVVARTRKVVNNLGQPVDIIVAVTGSGAVAARQQRAPPAIVIGVSAEHPDTRGGAVLPDRNEVAGNVVVVVHVEPTVG